MISAHRAELNHRYKTTPTLQRKAGTVSSRETVYVGAERMFSGKTGNESQGSSGDDWGSSVHAGRAGAHCS